MKLIKIDNYWIIISDKEIKENNWYLCWETLNNLPQNYLISNKTLHPYCIGADNYKKIIASQNPEHNLPSITFSDEVAKKLGIVNLDKLFPEPSAHDSIQTVYKWSGKREGYNQALSDNKDKLFTANEMYEKIAFWFGRGVLAGKENRVKELMPNKDKIIQSVNKQEYEVELENYPSKMECDEPNCVIPCACYHQGKPTLCGNGRTIWEPKITDNSIKVMKILS